MRRKEEGNDYRFSVEGDIPFVSLEQSFIDKIESELPELPHEKMNRFITEYKIDEYDADILTRSKAAADYFEQTAELVKDPRLASNWILSDVSRRLNEEEKSFETIEISPKQLADLLFLVKDGKINNNTAKKVLRAMFEEGVEPTDYVKEKGLIQITDDSALNEIVEKVLSDNLQSIEAIKKGLEKVRTVAGRFELLDTKTDYSVIIDYAHTPDGLQNILRTARALSKGRLILLFGCGGDRDRSKRPIMGKIAGVYSDFCIVTSDNPRSEDPMAIIEEILPGLRASKCPYEIIEDRKQAIAYGLRICQKDDLLIRAGKGHETYQILGDRTIHFDERENDADLLGREKV